MEEEPDYYAELVAEVKAAGRGREERGHWTFVGNNYTRPNGQEGANESQLTAAPVTGSERFRPVEKVLSRRRK